MGHPSNRRLEEWIQHSFSKFAKNARIPKAHAFAVHIEALGAPASPWKEDLVFAEEQLLEGNYERCRDVSLAIKEWAWEQLHAVYWKDVAVGWRELFTRASIFIAVCDYLNGEEEACVREMDVALLMGGPSLTNDIHAFLSTIRSANKSSPTHDSYEKRDAEDEEQHRATKKRRKDRDFLFVEQQEPPHMRTRQPLVIERAMDHWPALCEPERQWNNPHYLRKVCGDRTVPIELGKHYLDEEWTQQLMTMNKFINDHILAQTLEGLTVTGYLAQTQLFDIIQPLRRDICIPDYCSLSETIGEEEDIRINAWFGPANTVTPCHNDPTHNLLCQVVGYKYVRLYHPDENNPSVCLLDLANLRTQLQVDVENPDLDDFPLYSKAKYTDTILCPGQMLYIPPKWWHFVRSLSTSFSVSFWWQ